MHVRTNFNYLTFGRCFASSSSNTFTSQMLHDAFHGRDADDKLHPAPPTLSTGLMCLLA